MAIKGKGIYDWHIRDYHMWLSKENCVCDSVKRVWYMSEEKELCYKKINHILWFITNCAFLIDLNKLMIWSLVLVFVGCSYLVSRLHTKWQITHNVMRLTGNDPKICIICHSIGKACWRVCWAMTLSHEVTWNRFCTAHYADNKNR